PLLLGAGGDGAVDFAVGEEAARGPTAIEEAYVALDVHSAEGGGLRDGPFDVGFAVAGGDGGAGEVFDGAPEVAGGVATEPPGVGIEAGDDDIVWCGAETGDLGIEADADGEAVGAGLDEDGVAFFTELVFFLGLEDGGDFGLSVGRGRIDDED